MGCPVKHQSDTMDRTSFLHSFNYQFIVPSSSNNMLRVLLLHKRIKSNICLINEDVKKYKAHILLVGVYRGEATLESNFEISSKTEDAQGS